MAQYILTQDNLFQALEEELGKECVCVFVQKEDRYVCIQLLEWNGDQTTIVIDATNMYDMYLRRPNHSITTYYDYTVEDILEQYRCQVKTHLFKQELLSTC